MQSNRIYIHSAYLKYYFDTGLKAAFRLGLSVQDLLLKHFQRPVIHNEDSPSPCSASDDERETLANESTHTIFKSIRVDTDRDVTTEQDILLTETPTSSTQNEYYCFLNSDDESIIPNSPSQLSVDNSVHKDDAKSSEICWRTL